MSRWVFVNGFQTNSLRRLRLQDYCYCIIVTVALIVTALVMTINGYDLPQWLSLGIIVMGLGYLGSTIKTKS